MNIHKAIQRAKQAGWHLSTDDVMKKSRPVSCVFVQQSILPPSDKIQFCTWIQLYKMSYATFDTKLAELPRKQVA